MATVDNELPEKLSHNHPVFLSSINNFGAMLITIQLTGAENFSVWSRAMRIAILGRNKLGFIDGKCKEDAYGTNLADLWERCNTIVLSWIMNCVSKELLCRIVYSTNVAAVWSDLKERYDKVDGTRIFRLHREIASVTQGTNSISVYFSRLRDLWVEFDSITLIPCCDCAKSREFVVFMCNQKLLQFLMGLNEIYEQARGQILMMIPLPSLNKAYSLLGERESQRSICQSHKSGEHFDLTALTSTRTCPVPMNKLKKPYIPYNSGYDSTAFCDHCKRKGHTKAICYRLVGYLPDFERRKRENKNNNYSDKGNYHTERGNWHTAHNVVSDPMKHHEYASSSSGALDCSQGMNALHEQYNQILHMLGRSNLQASSDIDGSHSGTNTYRANSAQGTSSTNSAGPLQWASEGDW